MELSGIELRYLVNEIRNRVNTGYYVSSVNAITKDALIMILHHPIEQEIMLVLSTRGIWITRLKFKTLEENRLETAFKAEIERSKLESIEQMGSERIVTLKFRQLDGKTRIVIGEFFGEGNLILCDEGMQILAILNPIEVRHRTLNVGLRYAAPPSRGIDVFDISLEKLRSLKAGQKSEPSEKGSKEKEKGGGGGGAAGGQDLDVLRWIGRSISMPKKFVEEIALRSGVPGKRKVNELSEEDVGRIYSTVKDLVEGISTGKNHEPVVIFNEQGQNSIPVEAFPIVTGQEGNALGLARKKVPSYMEAVDEVLSHEIMDMGRSLKTVELDRQIALLEHDLEEQNKAKDKVLQKSASIRKLAGELMSISYSTTGIEDPKALDVLLSNSASIIKDKGVKYLDVSGEHVYLEPSLARMSSMLFARAKEKERGSVAIDQARTKLLAEIEKMKTKTAAIHKKIVAKQQISREWYERYRWFVTDDGLLAVGGRDASSNSALIRKHMTEHDVVFHAEVHGSPFFILKNGAAMATVGQQIEASIQQAAQATVSFSRAWKEGLSSADAYWVLPEQIKKGAPTGQFLPKGSFVIEGKRNYVKGIDMRLAIGITNVNGKNTIVCGPADAVKKRSLVYAVLMQGGMEPMSAAKKVKSELVGAAEKTEEELGEFIKALSLDDFIRALPNGQSKISFAARGEGQKATTITTATAVTTATARRGGEIEEEEENNQQA